MDIFNLIAGIVTIAAFCLALWQMYWNARNKIAETSKAEIELDRLRQSKHGVMACAETVNMLVQRTKETKVNAQELTNMARIARGQLLVIANELSKEEERLSHWEYGKIFKSTIQPPKTVNNAEEPKADANELHAGRT